MCFFLLLLAIQNVVNMMVSNGSRLPYARHALSIVRSRLLGENMVDEFFNMTLGLFDVLELVLQLLGHGNYWGNFVNMMVFNEIRHSSMPTIKLS